MADEKHTDVMKTIGYGREDLSASERRVADFILASRESVTTMSAREIARASGVSAATVSRFVRSLGFKNFADLRLALVRSTIGGVTANEDADSDQEQAAFSAEGSSGMIRLSLNKTTKELWSTAARLSCSEIEEAVEVIRGSRLVVVAAVGNTIPIAESASFLLSQIGVHAITPNTVDGTSVLALTLSADDCLLVLSNSGRSRRLALTEDNARDAGAKVIVVTQDVASPLARGADIVLRIDSQLLMFGGTSVRFQMSMYFAVMTLFLLVADQTDSAKDQAYVAQRTWSLDQGHESVRESEDDGLIG